MFVYVLLTRAEGSSFTFNLQGPHGLVGLRSTSTGNKCCRSRDSCNLQWMPATFFFFFVSVAREILSFLVRTSFLGHFRLISLLCSFLFIFIIRWFIYELVIVVLLICVTLEFGLIIIPLSDWYVLSSLRSCRVEITKSSFQTIEQIDKLKVLSESLVSSTSKAEKRISDHRYVIAHKNVV